jgi:mono/diheme cytochrome c family protein
VNTQVKLAGFVLLAVSSITPAVAQSAGADIYKAKCQICHGVTGMADTSVGKALKVKPVSDPEVRKFSSAAMIEATRNGMGKMQPFKNKLTDAEINDAVAHFRAFIK